MIAHYLIVFVLIFAAFRFALLALHFAEAGVKNGDDDFIVNIWRFILSLFIAQGCGILAGIEIAREILSNK